MMRMRGMDPAPNASAVVLFGGARFTVLTPQMVRMELPRADGIFDDLPTLTVLNRRLPVPPFTVTPLNATAIRIQTSALAVTYDSAGVGPVSNACAAPQNDTDQTGGTRVPEYPNGLGVASQGACCTVCNQHPDCTAWVYAPGIPASQTNCWIMEDVEGTTGASGRVFGGRTSAFPPSALHVDFAVNGLPTRWTPGQTSTQNLNGTYSSLDCYSTPDQCLAEYWQGLGQGLLSRDGWYVHDDTAVARFVPNPLGGNWTWWNNSAVDAVDWYFMAYGTNYRQQLFDVAQVAGPITLPPQEALGTWWSRYYPYSQTQFISEVLEGYANFSIPLSIVVLDMDWHMEPTAAGCSSWGGYDFNTNLFPDPSGFIGWLHSSANTVGHPLRLLLNIHPQTGVDHCQARYPAMARALGIDPSTNETVPCDFGNPLFAQQLYQIYLNASPLAGVDWWWTDYGGCGGPADGSLLWNNYVFDSFLSTFSTRRPLVLSRYGGLGNHRYPIGFSGDTFQAFETLDFEIKTTPMAANVLFGYWSHDIGGFHNGTGCYGDSDPRNATGSEMLLRWLQFASVGAIFRTHCDHCERRIWEFPYFPQMRDAFLLRSALGPYIYTHARRAFDTGVALVHPMYYDSPAADEAYEYIGQYMFGENVVAAPIATTVDPVAGTVGQDVWLPAGTWSNWNGTQVFAGPVLTTGLAYGRQDIPLFARSGSLLPLAQAGDVTTNFAETLLWTVFPGAANASGSIYEDDGATVAYLSSAGATTSATYSTLSSSHTQLVVSPTVGSFAGMPATRSHGLQVRGVAASGRLPTSIVYQGQPLPQRTSAPGWFVVTDSHSLAQPLGSLVVLLGPTPVTATVVVDLYLS